MKTAALASTMLAVVVAVGLLVPALPAGAGAPLAAAPEARPEVAVSVDIYGTGSGRPVLGGGDTTSVLLTNEGPGAVEVALAVEDDTGEAVLAHGLVVNGEKAWSEYRAVMTDDGLTLDMALPPPSDVPRGEIGGRVIIWAEAAAPPQSEDWTQWQNNARHHAVTATDEAVTDPKISWTYHADGQINVIPLVVGEVVYVFDGAGTLSAVNRSTGDLVWKNATGSSAGFQSSIPAYGDGKVFVATNDGHLCAFDAATGERLWSFKATGDYRNFECPLTYYDHHLYIGEGLSGGVAAKYYHCYDDHGNQIWRYEAKETSGFLWGGAVVVGDYLVIPVFEGKLVSLDRLTGTVSDTVDLTDPAEVSFARGDLGMIRSSVTYSQGYIYSTSENGSSIGYLFKTAFADGKFLDRGWSTPIRFSTSTPVVYDGRVYVGSGEHGDPYGHLRCIDDSDGSIIWSYEVYSGVKSSPTVAVAGGEVYIYFAVSLGRDDKVFCVNGSGELVWMLDPPDGEYILQGCTLSDGSVYFGTVAGALYCLRNA